MCVGEVLGKAWGREGLGRGWKGRLKRKVGKEGWKGRLERKVGKEGWKGGLERRVGDLDVLNRGSQGFESPPVRSDFKSHESSRKAKNH